MSEELALAIPSSYSRKMNDGPGSYIRFPIGPTTRHWFGPAHGLLEGARQGGVISKLSRTDLVGLLEKLVSIIEIELLNCMRLGLEPYALPSRLYKERRECTPCI